MNTWSMIHSFYLHNFANVFRHYQYMRPCLFDQPVSTPSKYISHLVDHRYFYDKYDNTLKTYVGHYTCGICRNAVAPMVLEDKARLNKKFLMPSLLPNYTSNPSVTGFAIKQHILSSISRDGLNITPELNQRMDVVLFQENLPAFEITKKEPVLYVSTAFNFRGIHGIIVRIAPKMKSGEQKLFMYPLQIMLAPDTHSNSRKKFFSEWETWTKNLQMFVVVPEFVWITPNAGRKKQYPKSPEWPAHTERYVTIKSVNMGIWKWYEKGKRSK